MLPALRNGSVPTIENGATNRLSNLFDHFFNDDLLTPLAVRPALAAPLSVWQDENNVYIELDAPGMTQDDIELTIENRDVTIRGERKSQHKGNGYDGRRYGSFEQRIVLPTAVQGDKADAKLANGVLCLTLPKVEEAKPRKIAIKCA